MLGTKPSSPYMLDKRSTTELLLQRKEEAFVNQVVVAHTQTSKVGCRQPQPQCESTCELQLYNLSST